MGIGNAMQKSRYLHVFHNERKALAYHALTQEMLIMTRDFGEKLQSPDEWEDPQIADMLAKKSMVVSDPEKDEVLRGEFIAQYRALNPVISILYLFPTHSCNLACTYCCVERNKTTSNIIDDVLNYDSVISWYSGFATDPGQIQELILYGGEPFLYPGRVSEICLSWRHRVAEVRTKSRISMVTNGTLINNQLADVVKEFNINVSVSIDGPKFIHDKQRIYRNGSGTYDEAYAGYTLLKDMQLNPGISCTLTPFSIEHKKEIIEWLVSEAKPKALGFNVILCVKGLNLLDTYVLDANRFIFDAFLSLRDYGIYEDKAMRKMNSFVNKKINSVNCGGIGRQVAVNNLGNASACHIACEGAVELCAHYSDVDPNIYPLSGYNLRWNSQMPLLDDSCQDCAALATCGGGCRYQDILTSDSIRPRRDRAICAANMQWINWMVQLVLEEAVS
jgi:uncharacterized protein